MSFITDLYNRLFNKQLKLTKGVESIKFSNIQVENHIKTILMRISPNKTELNLENLSKIKNICIDMNISQKDLNEIISYCPSISSMDLRNINIDNLDISKSNINNLDLNNVICNNFNISKSNIKGMIIFNSDMNNLKLKMPESIKDLVLYQCNNIDINVFKDIDLERFSITVDKTKGIKDLIEVKNIEEISKMENLEVLGLTNVKNANELTGQMSSLKKVCIENCGLKDIEGISQRFPNVSKLVLSHNPISEIKPILEYDNKTLEKMNVSLDNTNITASDAPIIKKCKFDDIYVEDTPLQQELMSKVIISSSEDKELSKCVNEYIFGSNQDEDITEWIKFQVEQAIEKSDEISTLQIPSEIVEKVMELDFVVDTADKIEIKLDSHPNLENLIQTLDKHKGKKGRCVNFLIEKISNLPKENMELLNSRYGITYSFDDNVDYNEYHIDEIQKIDEKIMEISEKLDKNKNDEQKIEQIDNMIKNEFTFILPEEEKYNFSTDGLEKEDKEIAEILNNKKYVTNTDEIDKYSNLYNLLKDKKITHKSFTRVFYELADRINIQGKLESKLIYNGGSIITVNTLDSNGQEITVDINGIDEISKKNKNNLISNKIDKHKENKDLEYDR